MSTENLNINPENETQKIFSYKNYFKGTKILKDNFSDKDLKIESNMRVFKSKEKDCGYDEIFLNEDSEIFGGISNQISFLYPHNIRGYQNRIGFRYYKEEPLSSKNDIPYFTLVKCGVRKFFIFRIFRTWRNNAVFCFRKVFSGYASAFVVDYYGISVFVR